MMASYWTVICSTLLILSVTQISASLFSLKKFGENNIEKDDYGLSHGALSMAHFRTPVGRVSNKTRPCPCSSESLCEPVTKVHEKEVYTFTVNDSNWKYYDWSKVTTVSLFHAVSDDLMCFAHSKGVRVVGAGDYPKDKLLNETSRHEWVESAVNFIAYNFLDGYNLDFEEGISEKEEPQRAALTKLVRELTSAIKTRWPNAQVSFDYPFSPDCIYSRCFDYKGMTEILDFAVIMAYDLPVSGRPQNIAGSRNAYGLTYSGLQAYLKEGIPASKLVLGVPWYGYRFLCKSYNMTNDHCLVGSSDQRPYSNIMEVYLAQSFTGRRWDPATKSPFLSTRDPFTGSIYQVWYDDRQSLSFKYELARALNLRGVGMWNADSLDYGDAAQSLDMWGPI